jgi:ribosomal protein L33
LEWFIMAKKKELGICALMGGGYFSVRKVSSGTQKHGIQLRKYDPVARKHILVKSGKSRRITKS